MIRNKMLDLFWANVTLGWKMWQPLLWDGKCGKTLPWNGKCGKTLPWDGKYGKTLPWDGQQSQVVVGDKLPRDGVFFSYKLFTE